MNVFFFQVGHTHCDIDQLFSHVSIYLKDKHIFTFEDLCNAVKEALGGWPWSFVKYAVKLKFFDNWRDTIDSMFISSHKLEGITRFRYFRLRIFINCHRQKWSFESRINGEFEAKYL